MRAQDDGTCAAAAARFFFLHFRSWMVQVFLVGGAFWTRQRKSDDRKHDHSVDHCLGWLVMYLVNSSRTNNVLNAKGINC